MPHLIVGHTTSNSSRIWVRALPRWPVAFIEVLDAADNPVLQPRPIETVAEEFHTAVFDIAQLQADTQYRVKLSFAKSKSRDEPRVRQAYCESRFRTFPDPAAAGPIRFTFGSCNLHSLGLIARPDRAWNNIGSYIEAFQPHLMLHCGDQIYADVPFQPMVSLDHYRDKYLDAWEDCVPAQRVLTLCPHYMILDDHEIYNNFDGDDRDPASTELLLSAALKVYWEFQHSHNPVTKPGDYHYQFSCGAARFFVMNTRTYRDSSQNEIIDEKQLSDLKRWLASHKADLKFIVTSVPFVAMPRDGGADKWHGFNAQRDDILDFMIDNEVQRTVFLTGDMHNSMASELVIEKDARTLTVHELMSSPINQITPDTPIARRYQTKYAGVTQGGASVSAAIIESSFYAHSNVMEIEVRFEPQPSVSYAIKRTTKVQDGPRGTLVFA